MCALPVPQHISASRIWSCELPDSRIATLRGLLGSSYGTKEKGVINFQRDMSTVLKRDVD